MFSLVWRIKSSLDCNPSLRLRDITHAQCKYTRLFIGGISKLGLHSLQSYGCVRITSWITLVFWDCRHLHHLWSAYIGYLCLICNSNRFHSFILKLCIMIVLTLKMCTDDAGPEQSLVLIFLALSDKSPLVISCFS